MIARVLAALLARVAAALLVRTLWQRASEPERPAPTPAATPTSTATHSPPPTPAQGFRLAGTAAGLRGRYAVFEDPSGATEMYKVGDEIPGLGRLLRVGELDAAVTTSTGEVQYRVRPAPTKLPESTPSAKRVRKPAPTPDPSESESFPSDEPAPPAS
jgi:hypothetical protein